MKDNKPTILILDGKHIAYKCRYKFNLSYRGLDTSVLYGFLRMTYSLMNRYKPVSVIVCWDHGVPAYRKQICPEYKAHRGNHDDDFDYQDFIEQVSELEHTLGLFGICSTWRDNCEGDDLMYHASRMLTGRKIIVTSDHDLYQAINDDTLVYSHTKDIEIRPDNFEQATDGVSMKMWMMYLTLTGDSGDNIPGVPGVGHKTALKMLANATIVGPFFNSVYALELPGSKRLVDAINAHQSQDGFVKAYKCMDLSPDIAGARRQLLDDFKVWKPMDHDAVIRYLKSYAFISLMEPAFYEIMKRLQSPLDFLTDIQGMRFPKVLPKRRPVEEETI